MGHLWYNEKRAGLALGAGLPPPPPLLPLLLLLLPMLPLIGAKGTSHIQVRNNLHIRIISYTKYRVCKGRKCVGDRDAYGRTCTTTTTTTITAAGAVFLHTEHRQGVQYALCRGAHVVYLWLQYAHTYIYTCPAYLRKLYVVVCSITPLSLACGGGGEPTTYSITAQSRGRSVVCLGYRGICAAAVRGINTWYDSSRNNVLQTA